MDYLNAYVTLFGEEPPRTITMGYDNDTYTFLIMKALASGKPITPEDLDKALEGEKYDLVISDKKFSSFGEKD